MDLPPGHYDLEVSHDGFGTYRQTGVLLDLDSAKVLNVKLTVGQVSEQVQVTSGTVQLDTGSTQMGEVISGETMTAVPLVTRSYTDLLALQPGVSAALLGPRRRPGRSIQRHRFPIHTHFRRPERGKSFR